MNATQPASQNRQAEQRANEPSMEEILASIRRIIADDQAFSGRNNAHVADEETAEPERPEPVASLHQHPAPVPPPAPTVLHYPAPQPQPHTADLDALRGAMDDSSPARAVAPVAAPEPVRAPVQMPEIAPDTPIVSPQTDAAVGSAFSALVASQFVRESALLPELVREMLRPMLKMWLDDNLPVIVERLVRVEIERVARGTR